MPKQSVINEKAFRWAGRMLGPIALFEWGAILTYFYFSRRLAAFLHPNFHVLVLVTGFLLLGTAACLLFLGEDDIGADYCCEDENCGHAYKRLTVGRSLAFLVLLVPMALAAKISPDHYGMALIRNRGVTRSLAGLPGEKQTGMSGVSASMGKSAVSSSGDAKAPSETAQPLAVEVGDLLMAAEKPASMREFDGKRVELSGQFFPSAPNSFELVRMLILCCAADAQPLAVRIENGGNPGIADMAWAKVIGRVSFAKKGSLDVPVVSAEKITAIPQPADPFVYHGGSRVIAPPRHAAVKFQLPPR